MTNRFTTDKMNKISKTDPAWPGFTLEEIRYERAYAAAKTEISKERLMATAAALSGNGKKDGIVHAVMGGLGFIDYGVIAFRIGSKIFRLVRSLRRSKKR